MDFTLIPKDQLNRLMSTIEEIRSTLNAERKKPEEPYLDNQDLLNLLKISKRTAQLWREQGKIAYSQIGGKIFYYRTDIEKLIRKHYVQPKKNEIKK